MILYLPVFYCNCILFGSHSELYITVYYRDICYRLFFGHHRSTSAQKRLLMPPGRHIGQKNYTRRTPYEGNKSVLTIWLNVLRKGNEREKRKFGLTAVWIFPQHPSYYLYIYTHIRAYKVQFVKKYCRSGSKLLPIKIQLVKVFIYYSV